MSVGTSANPGKESTQARVRMIEYLMVPCHRVHYPTNGIAAVQQCCWPLDDFEPFQAQRIDSFAMVSRLGRKCSCPDAILQDKHPVIVKPTNYRSRGAGTEASLGYTGLA